MPGKPHHQILIFRRTVWLSTYFNEEEDIQWWRVYKRPRSGWRTRCPWWRPWFSTLTPQGDVRTAIRNTDIPRPFLRGYAFTEWSWDVPQRPAGTNLWIGRVLEAASLGEGVCEFTRKGRVKSLRVQQVTDGVKIVRDDTAGSAFQQHLRKLQLLSWPRGARREVPLMRGAALEQKQLHQKCHRCLLFVCLFVCLFV